MKGNFLNKLSLKLPKAKNREKYKQELLRELNDLGVNEFQTYSDLDSLSRFLRWSHKNT
jgi:hypothetical protein